MDEIIGFESVKDGDSDVPLADEVFKPLASSKNNYMPGAVAG